MAKVLVVDDVALNRTLIVTLLGYKGHEVIEAADGAEALARVHADHPDVVISDILMPTMDGFEFVRQLRADPAIAGTAVIFYTAHYHQREARNLARACGVARVLLKPCDPEDILKCVSDVLSPGSSPGLALSQFPQDFDHSHKRLITDQLSRESGQLESANARLAALNELNVHLASERDMHRLLRSVCTAARELFGAKYAVLLVKQEATGPQRFFATSGISSDKPLTCPNLDDGPLRSVVAEGICIRLSNLQADPSAVGLPHPYPPAHCALMAPLASPTEVHGWICLVDKPGADEFTAEDEQLLRTLAAQVGRVYENGGLLVQVKRYTEELLNEMAEREYAVAELRESERRYSQLLGNVGLISVMLDTESRITYCNDYLLHLSGWAREEVIGRDWFEIFAPPGSTQWRALWAALLQDNPIASYNESELVTRSGERRLVRWSNSLLRTARGVPTGTASIGEDITEQRAAAQKVVDSELRFRQLAENIDDLFYIASPGLAGMLYLSPAYERIWRRSLPALGENAAAWSEAIHPDERDQVMADLHANALKKTATELDFRIVRPDSTVRWIHLRTFPVLSASGDIVRLVGAATDITERKLAQDKVEKLNRVVALLSGINSLIIRSTDRRELLKDACNIAVEHGRFKLARITLQDSSVGEWCARANAGSEPENRQPGAHADGPSDDEHILGTLAISSQRPAICNDLRADPRPSRGREAMLAQGYKSIVALPLIVGTESIGSFVLISNEADSFTDAEMRILHEVSGDVALALDHIGKTDRLKYLAYHDPMTGLPNRIFFAERLARLVASAPATATRFAVVVADIRRFESINESFGRQIGDEVMLQVAQRFLGCVGVLHDLARVGSDQFAAVIMNVTDAEDIEQRIDQWRGEWLDEPFLVDGHELHLSARIGTCVFPDDGTDARGLLHNSESALGRAKATGVAGLFYSPPVGQMITNELAVEQKLRHALANGEFVLHYQPKVDLQMRRVTGVEALIRWQSPALGLVPPIRFIPLMEETGLIVETGLWVLRQAINDRARWFNHGISAPRVAINVSTVQLRRHDFVENMTRILGSGGSGDGIDFEITESAIINDVACNMGKLKAMRDLGVGIALDDFGTGYSSLSYLAKLPVELLKIDRSFIAVMLEDSAVMTLVSTMITMAHALHLTVIAEGVESEEQARILRLLHCDQMQGYLVSKPLTFDDMAEFLLQETAVMSVAS